MVFIDLIKQIEENAELIVNPSFERLRMLSLLEGERTAYGSIVYSTKVKGRSAKHTEVIEDRFTKEQKKIIAKLITYIKLKKMIRIDRRMCNKKPFYCRAYVSADYPHIAYMWAKMLFDISKKQKKKPDFITVQIPEWPETKIIVDPKTRTTLVLGSDYTGELKKANLRMAMYQTKLNKGLGLHAGTKLIRVRDKDGKLREKGVLLFGLSATGKTTLTCHHHWLDKKKDEGVVIRQDDVVLMQKDSSCIGTENNFYIKTDGLEPKDQGLLYNAAISKHALFENVKLLKNKIDFFDDSITTNGRAVVLRKEMKYTDNSIDLKQADMILFITRRRTIIPPVVKLNQEQGAGFFMLGESIGSSASDVDPGRPRRVVGTNPFIIGSMDEEGNRFYKLLKKNKHVDCYLLNTGSVGWSKKDPGEKITVHDSAVIIREIAKETVKWKKDSYWNYEILDHCPGVDVSKFHPEKHYSKKEYEKLTKELKKQRKQWLKQFKNLRSEVKNAI